MRILLIDDHPIYIEGLEAYLNKAFPGLSTDKAYRSEDAIELVESNRYDIILLDYSMPSIDGLDLLAVFKRKRIISPTIIVSAISPPDDISIIYQAKMLGACGFAHKTSAPEYIGESIKKVIELGQSWPDSTLSRLNSFHRSQKNSDSEFNLSPCQIEITKLLSKGYSYSKIAALQCVSENTAKSHIKKIYEKMNVNSRAQLIHELLKNKRLK
ncbi:response regulator transcription factor [bacterium]|nr:response regulator transcription factor [bacterium]